MSIKELLQTVEFVIDAEGHKKAVQLDMVIWQEIVSLLEQLEAAPVDTAASIDTEAAGQKTSKGRKRLLKAVISARQAYQLGQVKRGQPDDLITELMA